MQGFRLPRLHDVIFIVVLAGGLVLGTRMLNTDSDLGRHLALGSYIIQNRQVPTHDILSYTKAGESRPPYEWLSQVLFAGAYRLLGLDGVVLLTACGIAAAFAVVLADALRRSEAPIVTLAVTAWAAMASSLHWLTRPHVFSFLFFALWLTMLERLRRGEHQPLWQFPLLMVVWANTHGGFVYGFLALAAYAAGGIIDRWRKRSNARAGWRLMAAGALSLAASIVTPDLWHNWEATLANRSGYVLARTMETMPPNLAAPGVWPFVLLAALSVVLMAVRYRELDGTHPILLGGLGVMSFAMTRNIPFFVIAAAPLCSEWLAAWMRRVARWSMAEEQLAGIERGLRGFAWSVAAVTAAAVVFAYHQAEPIATTRTVYAFSPQVFPVGAVDWLEQNPPEGRMFNDFNWGGYLLYRMWPEQRVFIDSQSDFYGEQFVREYANILAGEAGWQGEMDRYGITWMIVPPGAGIAQEARQSPEWRVAYQDATAVVLVRK